MVEGNQEIRESLKILFNAPVGSRTTLLEFGSRLRRMLFDPLDTHFDARIEEHLRNAVSLFEPRIVLEEVHIDRNREMDGRVDIALTYIVRANNVRSNAVFPFYKLEGTNIDNL